MSFTKVRVNPNRSTSSAGWTSYSRTARALPPHTDDTYRRWPRELVAFQMVQPDCVGGESVLVDAEAWAKALDGAARQALAKSVFDFGRGQRPILSRCADGYQVRYYRAQLDRIGKLDPRGRALLDEVDGILNDPTLQLRFRLPAGAVLFLNNTRLLHGRTALTPTGGRLLYRVRVQAATLRGSPDV